MLLLTALSVAWAVAGGIGTANATERDHLEAKLGGVARVDYYSASKQLDNAKSLPGLMFQPKAQATFGRWGDGKVEGRLQDVDLRGPANPQGRLLEAYGTVYLGPMDVRVGKQIMTWGRADFLNPTDNLTPRDFTLLSAKDEEERRTGSVAVKANRYWGTHTLSLIWLPVFNPSTVPFGSTPGIRLTEQKRSNGDWTNQGFAVKWDQTGGDLDWSLSYYSGLDLFPIGRPVGPTQVDLIHTRLHVIGADAAWTVGRYGMRVEGAYVHTQNPSGEDPFLKKPYAYYVAGIDRDLTDDLNVSVQAYQRIVINYRDPFTVQGELARNVAVLDAVFNQQLDGVQEGLSGRMKATWLNKTFEGELLGVWNANRGDVFVRPSLAYAFTDTWKGFVGYDIFNGRAHSFFGRLESSTAAFLELRATF